MATEISNYFATQGHKEMVERINQIDNDEFWDDEDENNSPTTDDCCPYCGAIWGIDELDRERCASCGWVVGTVYEGNDDEDDEDYEDYTDRTCPECNGSGGDRWNDGVVPCKLCQGAGYIS